MVKEKVLTQVPGNVWKITTQVNDQVKKGDLLFIMEVMKTEVPHNATVDGCVKAIHITEGQEGLEAGFVAMEIE